MSSHVSAIYLHKRIEYSMYPRYIHMRSKELFYAGRPCCFRLLTSAAVIHNADCLGADWPGTEGKVCIYDNKDRRVLTNSEQYETHVRRIDGKLAHFMEKCNGNWQCLFTDPEGMPANYFSQGRYVCTVGSIRGRQYKRQVAVVA